MNGGEVTGSVVVLTTRISAQRAGTPGHRTQQTAVSGVHRVDYLQGVNGSHVVSGLAGSGATPGSVIGIRVTGDKDTAIYEARKAAKRAIRRGNGVATEP